MKNFLQYFMIGALIIGINADEKPINIVHEYAKRAFGGFSISQELFNYILKNLPKGNTILELGSGWATGELIKHYTVYSVEHNERWLDKYGSHYIYAPIRNYSLEDDSYSWYDIEVLKRELPEHYDLILVDGPPASIGRIGFSKNLSLFKTESIIIIFDDVNRKSDLENMKEVARILNRPYKIITGKTKNFGVIVP